MPRGDAARDVVEPAHAHPPSAWPAVAADLRRALVQAGRSESQIGAMLEALRPVVAAVERAGTRIDLEIAWALVGVIADRQRRRAQHVRIAEHRPAGLERRARRIMSVPAARVDAADGV